MEYYVINYSVCSSNWMRLTCIILLDVLTSILVCHTYTYVKTRQIIYLYTSNIYLFVSIVYICSYCLYITYIYNKEGIPHSVIIHWGKTLEIWQIDNHSPIFYLAIFFLPIIYFIGTNSLMFSLLLKVLWFFVKWF